MKTVFPIFYAAPSLYYAYWLKIAPDNRYIETCAHYQKQTYRNRCTIAGPNGSHDLIVPVRHTKKQKPLDRTVTFENSTHWRKTHLKTYETFYRSSPFFEFYEEEFSALFQQEFSTLLDFNLALHQWILDQLELDSQAIATTTYSHEYTLDLRDTIHPKKTTINYPKYHQVFIDKLDFIQPTSILDLLFCEGTNAMTILQQLSKLI